MAPFWLERPIVHFVPSCIILLTVKASTFVTNTFGAVDTFTMFKVGISTWSGLRPTYFYFDRKEVLCSSGSVRPHRTCCPLASNVEYIARRHAQVSCFPKSALPLEIRIPVKTCFLVQNQGPQPKRHLYRLSRFCRAHHCVQHNRNADQYRQPTSYATHATGPGDFMRVHAFDW